MHLSGRQFWKLSRRHVTFAFERLDVVWRNFDASFKGILTTGGDKTYSHRTGRRVAHSTSQPEQMTSATFRRSYLSSRKAKT